MHAFLRFPRRPVMLLAAVLMITGGVFAQDMPNRVSPEATVRPGISPEATAPQRVSPEAAAARGVRGAVPAEVGGMGGPVRVAADPLANPPTRGARGGNAFGRGGMVRRVRSRRPSTTCGCLPIRLAG